jgi:hypothetical protein
MYLNIFTYLWGSALIVHSIFVFSDYYSNYLYDVYLKNDEKINIIKKIEKKDKINEWIYSSIHGTLSSTLAIISLNSSIFDFNFKTNNLLQPDNQMQYLTVSICFSYFVIDLLKCIYNKKYLFILHHIASIILLSNVIYSFHLKRNIGYYAMYNIFLLESNTVLLNIGFLLKELNFHYSITCMSWIIHLLCFVSFRLLMLPILIARFYLFEPFTFENIIYLPNFFLIISGSVYWAYRQTVGIKKYLKENSVI